MRGVQPKPSWLKVLDGNPGGRPIGGMKVRPVEVLEPPEYFGDEQRAIWAKVCEVLRQVNALTPSDQFVLARYVELTWQYRMAERWMRDNSQGQVAYAVYKEGKPDLSIEANRGDPKKKLMRSTILPQLRAMLEISNHLLRIEAHFGLTPSSRAAFGRLGGGSGGDDNPFDNL